MSALRNRTVRCRLTLLLAALILVTSLVLLAVSYVLVNANLSYGTQGPAAPPASAASTRSPASQPTGRSLHGGGGVPRGSPTGRPAAVSARGHGGQIEVAHHVRSALLGQYAVILGAAILTAAVVAWLIAGRLLRPLRTITAGARRITGERLHERLALPGPPDEIKDLGDTFDAMLARLETAFQDQQLFAANAAHELRTPLGVMHAELDLALASEPPGEQQEMLRRLKRTVLACERLTERLLSLARGQVAAADRHRVALDQVAAERLALAGPAAHELTVREDLRPAVVQGDPELLGQLAGNLIENAIKYNLAHGWIEVRLHPEGEQAILEVANSGPKLATHELADLLKPFRRAARQRVGAGHGLGLSIVRTIVTAHDGQLALHALPDGGLRVVVTLPLAGERLAPLPGSDRASTRVPAPISLPDRSGRPSDLPINSVKRQG
jgi:hypothetical protein